MLYSALSSTLAHCIALVNYITCIMIMIIISYVQQLLRTLTKYIRFIEIAPHGERLLLFVVVPPIKMAAAHKPRQNVKRETPSNYSVSPVPQTPLCVRIKLGSAWGTKLKILLVLGRCRLLPHKHLEAPPTPHVPHETTPTYLESY